MTGDNTLKKFVELMTNQFNKKIDNQSMPEVDDQTVKDIFNDGIYGHTHRYDTIIETKDSTCTEAGYIKKKCRCGDTTSETIEQLPHSFVKNVIPSTCTEDGKTVYHCTMCGLEHEDQYTPRLDHSYEEIIIEPATCSEMGITRYKCTRCEDYYDEMTSKLPHQLGAWEVLTMPTSTKEGLRVKRCTVCNEIVKSEAMRPTGGDSSGSGGSNSGGSSGSGGSGSGGNVAGSSGSTTPGGYVTP